MVPAKEIFLFCQIRQFVGSSDSRLDIAIALWVIQQAANTLCITGKDIFARIQIGKKMLAGMVPKN